MLKSQIYKNLVEKLKNKDIFKPTLPVMFGYIPLSMAYAILGVSCDIDAKVLVLFSFFVYAGSGQFLLVALLSTGTNLAEVFIATFLLNLRHMFYTISLMSDIVNLKYKFYTLFALTDESFAVLKTMEISDKNRDKIYFLIPFLNQIYWIFGTIIGVLIGKNIEFNSSGIEFCLVSLFIVLAYETFKHNMNFNLLSISILVGIFGLFLPKEYMLVASILVGFIIILSCREFFGENVGFNKFKNRCK